MMKSLILVLYVLSVSVQDISADFELNILHYNDFHARFVETNPWGGVCNPDEAPCIGGFARLVTAVKEGLQREPQSLLLNGGDSFQGTIWYNLLRWNVTQDFMNLLPHDAHVLGNHEFDNGIDGLVPYLQHLDSVMVTANIIDDEEPDLHGLYQPSIVVEREGRKIGIIGVIIATTNINDILKKGLVRSNSNRGACMTRLMNVDEAKVVCQDLPTLMGDRLEFMYILASTGKLVFTDEVETVRREAQRLHEQGVDVIVVLSHCGLEIDHEIARGGGPHIDVIVGGHSHSLLYNGEPPAQSGFNPVGPYPVVVETEERTVLIVQAAAHTQYLGEIKLYFNEEGQLQSWNGTVHYLGNEIAQDPNVLEKLSVYSPMIDEMGKVEIGNTMVDLSSSCDCRECNLGNFICDAFLDYTLNLAEDDKWNLAHFCVMNRGGIRANIGRGVITYESLLASSPFENNMEIFDLRGDHIWEMFEFSALNEPWPGANTLQVSGIRSVIDGSRPAGSRVTNIYVRCIECDVPRYEPIKLGQYYKVVTSTFLGEGGDGFAMIPENRINLQVVGVDIAVIETYIKKQSPIYSEVDGRLQLTDPCSQ